MLEELTVSGLGVISSAELRLGPGFTVITGETGAGKTMLLTAIDLLMGGRADAELVRRGAASALVQARICAKESSPVVARAQDAGAELDGGALIAARSVAAQGRSRAFLGGRSVPQAVLGEVVGALVTVHGQGNQARLRSAGQQRQVLDDFAGAKHLRILADYQRQYLHCQELAARIDSIQRLGSERAQQADLLRFGCAEIARIAPIAGEDAELAETANRLANAEDLRSAAQHALAAIAGSGQELAEVDAGTLVDGARAALEAADGDSLLIALSTRLAEVSYLLADIGSELLDYAQQLEADPERLAQVQQRLADIHQLTRKYGPELTDVLTWADQAQQRLVDLDMGAEELAELREQLEADRRELAAIAARLTRSRTKAGRELTGAVGTELAALAMSSARFGVRLQPSELGSAGAEAVEFTLAAHPGAPPRALAKAASGGELSRVMLAIEVALAERGGGDLSDVTFVFDEVDAGVGGEAAVEIGRRLAQLSRQTQVIVVTHLPQVAAFANRQLVVEKSTGPAMADSEVVEVTGADRERELARMLAGQSDSAAAREHAAELLALATWHD